MSPAQKQLTYDLLKHLRISIKRFSERGFNQLNIQNMGNVKSIT